MMKWVTGIALLGVLALGGALYRETTRAARLEAENTALSTSVETLKTREELNRASQKVLAKELIRRSEKAAEYDKLRIALERGGEDETLPDWFTHYVNCLLAGGSGENHSNCP